jgi:6-phosphogluconolactonase (cycloisomerase 2 family)
MALSVVLMGLGASAGAASASAPPVALTQLAGTAGCISGDGSSDAGLNTCAVGREIVGPESVTLSPDGKFVYVGSYEGAGSTRAGLAVFSRNATTGKLTQVAGTGGCYTADGSENGVANACTKVRGIGNGDGNDFLITSDGRWAYMVNQQESNVVDPAPSVVIFQRDPATGVLTQPSGTAGCLSSDGSSQDGANTCQELGTLGSPNGISISSNQQFLYVEDYAPNQRIHVLSRDPTTGALSEIQCLSESALSGCSTGRDLGDSKTLVLSTDGHQAYSADYSHNGVAIFDRDPTTGLLTQKTGAAGCISNNGKDNTGASTCATAREMDHPEAESISSDGHTLYLVAYADSGHGGLDIFHVNSDGTLTELSGTSGCASDDGNDTSGAATCARVRGFDQPYGSTISPDGDTLYVTQFGGGVAVFSLDQSTGAATQLAGLAGCITPSGNAGACATARGLSGAYEPAVSPDGHFVYIASDSVLAANGTLTVFSREAPTCTTSSASTPFQSPVTVSLHCTDADGDPLTLSIVSRPHHGKLGPVNAKAHKVSYAPAKGFHGVDTFTFRASDGTNLSPPATAAIVVKPLPPPALSKVSESHKNWRRGTSTTFSFTLSEAARVTFAFTHGGSSVGRMTKSVHAGKDKVTFKGHLNGHALAPGSYAVTIRASNKWGKSRSRHLSFKILNSHP